MNVSPSSPQSIRNPRLDVQLVKESSVYDLSVLSKQFSEKVDICQSAIQAFGAKAAESDTTTSIQKKMQEALAGKHGIAVAIEGEDVPNISGLNKVFEESVEPIVLELQASRKKYADLEKFFLNQKKYFSGLS